MSGTTKDTKTTKDQRDASRLALFTRGRVTLLERDDEGSPPVIRGYGAVFYDAADAGTEYDLYGDGEYVERIAPGAFDRALREDDVRSLFNHDSNFVLGRRKPGDTAATLRLSVDEKGLRYEVTPPDSRGDVVEAVRRGDVDGSSFMFIPTRTTWSEENRDGERRRYIRTIEEVELWEVGPVVFPAYESATSGLRARSREALEQERLESVALTFNGDLRDAIAKRMRLLALREAG